VFNVLCHPYPGSRSLGIIADTKSTAEKFARSHNLPFKTENLKDGTQAYWLRKTDADILVLYFHSLSTLILFMSTRTYSYSS